MADKIEVDMYIMGQYVGKRKIGRGSICGAILAGRMDEADKRTTAMKDELEQLGAKVNVNTKVS